MASEYLKWKYRDVRPEEPVALTKEQRRRNWWDYHKWYVILGAVLLVIAGDWARGVLTQVHPDYQIAYVGSTPLSPEEAGEWERRLAALGSDCNGDGKIVVQLNQYPATGGAGDPQYAYASNVQLMADLEGRDSYFFLLEDPEGFQTSYDILENDWLPAGNGLFLARRSFWQERTAEYMEECQQLWDQLTKEGIA